MNQKDSSQKVAFTVNYLERTSNEEQFYAEFENEVKQIVNRPSEHKVRPSQSQKIFD